jgi:hypothetical protein
MSFVSNDEMNIIKDPNVVILCRQRRYERSAILVHLFYPYGAMHFMPMLGFCTRRRGIFTGLSQDKGQIDFSENLLASLFNDDLSNEPTSSQIHLVRQYL